MNSAQYRMIPIRVNNPMRGNTSSGLMKCSGMCIPFYIQIIIHVIALIYIALMPLDVPKHHEVRARFSLLACSLVGAFISIGLTYWLCSNCHQGWAWAYLIIPMIIYLLFVFFFIDLVANIFKAISRE
jgi:apolipoprotein N-acyltransferase